MASPNYYGSQPEYQPYQAYGNDAAPAYTSAPSYTSRAEPHGVSPFEAPFDDHVYPARPQDSQQSFGSSTYGQGPKPQDTSEFRDDIPLRDQGRKHMSTDHVYDAAELGMAAKRENKRPGFNFFRKSGGRIPWVVYTLTIIQTAVFIAEIVKSGKYLV